MVTVTARRSGSVVQITEAANDNVAKQMTLLHKLASKEPDHVEYINHNAVYILKD